MENSNKELVEKAIQGDLESLEKLLETFSDKIAAIARYVCINSPQDADDVHSETMLSIIKNIKKFKFKSDFSTWFYRIAINHCWMKFRKRKQEKLISFEDVKDILTHERRNNLEISHDFYKILSKLDNNSRSVIILVDIEGYSLKEASEKLGITVGALKSRLFRARKMFKKEMEKYDGVK